MAQYRGLQDACQAEPKSYLDVCSGKVERGIDLEAVNGMNSEVSCSVSGFAMQGIVPDRKYSASKASRSLQRL